MRDHGEAHAELLCNFETATSSLVQQLRDMAERVDSRVAKFKTIKNTQASAPDHEKRRAEVLRNVTEGVASIERTLDAECAALEEQDPLVVFRQQMQVCETNEEQHLEGLLDHLQGIGLDLNAIPSVVKWQSRKTTGLSSQVMESSDESPLAQQTSRPLFDVAQSPAMGVLESRFSAKDGWPLGKSHVGSGCNADDKDGTLCSGRTWHADPAPRIKNWATLQEQNERLAAILAQHGITLNAQGI